MKLLISKKILLESLSNVSRAINPRNIIPVLNGIIFNLNKDGLHLTASDSDLTIKTFIDKKDIKNIEKTGSALIPSKYLLEIIRKLPNDDISIEVVDNFKVIIKTGEIVFNLNCLDINEYPEIKTNEIKKPIILNSDTFKEIISQTIFAVSTQESRPLLTGLNFSLNEKELKVVTTDSYRLAQKIITLENTYDEFDIVVPSRGISELDKILTLSDDLEIHPTPKKILFKYGNYVLETSLLSGSYPNTSNLIPTEFDFILKTSTSGYYNGIDRASLLTQNKDKNIVKMETTDDNILITSYSSEIGQANEKIPATKNIDSDIEISFSSKYMLDALKTIKDEDLLILLNNDTSPIILKSTKDESLIQLVLPIKTY